MILSVNAGIDKCGFITTLRQQMMFAFLCHLQMDFHPNACEKTKKCHVDTSFEGLEKKNHKIFNWKFTKHFYRHLPRYIFLSYLIWCNFDKLPSPFFLLFSRITYIYAASEKDELVQLTDDRKYASQHVGGKRGLIFYQVNVSANSSCGLKLAREKIRSVYMANRTFQHLNSAAAKDCPCHSAVKSLRTWLRLLGKPSTEITWPSSLFMNERFYICTSLI